MAKISIDLAANYRGNPTEKRIPFPTQTQAERALKASILTLDMLGDIAKLVEVIKIDFLQLTPGEVIKDSNFIEFDSASVTDIEPFMTLRMNFTAILSGLIDKEEKLKVIFVDRPSFDVDGFDAEKMCYHFALKITDTIKNHLKEKKDTTEIWEEKMQMIEKNVVAHAPLQPGYGDD